MSEPDDKPEAGKAQNKPRSLFDSDWDTLLGASASSSPSSPTFAPPKLAVSPAPPIPPEPAESESESAEPASSEPRTEPASTLTASSEPRIELASADESPRATLTASSEPRTSEAEASLSGEFLAPEPRPEPKTPPRYEPPKGVTPDYDNADEETEDRLPILPPPSGWGSDSEDDRDDGEPEGAKVIELARSRRTEAAGTDGPREPELEPEREPSGLAKLVYIVGVIAAIVLVVVFVKKSGERGATPRAPDELPTQPSEPDLSSKLGTSDEGSKTGTETGGSGEGETGGSETGESSTPQKPTPSTVDPRDPSLIPPGTPEENAKAFIKLPVSIHDGPPIGGIGRTGIHIDAISTSRGRDNTECDQPTRTFSIGVAKYVNVCFRVVHPREQETLRVIWEKDGKVTRRGRVRIPELHAYTTRAYLLLRPEYVGDWRVRIVPEGEETIDLAVAQFVITE